MWNLIHVNYIHWDICYRQLIHRGWWTKSRVTRHSLAWPIQDVAERRRRAIIALEQIKSPRSGGERPGDTSLFMSHTHMDREENNGPPDNCGHHGGLWSESPVRSKESQRVTYWALTKPRTENIKGFVCEPGTSHYQDFASLWQCVCCAASNNDFVSGV